MAPVTPDIALEAALSGTGKVSDAALYLPFDTDADDASGNGLTPSTESGGIIYPAHVTPQVGSGAVQLAEATTNQVLNPSAEAAGNFGAILAAAVVASADTMWIGTKTFKVTTTAAVGDGIFLTLAALANVDHYVTIRSYGALPDWEWMIGGGVWHDMVTIGTENGWFVYGLYVPAAEANASMFLRIRHKVGTIKIIYIDGAQVEALVYPTPYCDGSLGPGHAWTGAAHASTSTRTVTNLQYTPYPPGKGSISTWLIPFTLPNEVTSEGRLFSWWEDASNCLELYYNLTIDKVVLVWAGGGTTKTIIDIDLVRFQAYHYTVTYDGTTLTLYRDGVSVGTQTSLPTMTTAPSVLHLGRYGGSMSGWLNGWLDEFVVLDYALTANEVAVLYEHGLYGAPFDGVWTNLIGDVTTKEKIRAKYGIMNGGPIDRVATTGTMNFALRNDDGNSGGLLGYYSPTHANVRSGWEIGVPARLKITYSGSTRYKWTGKADSITPDPGKYRDRKVRVSAVDWFDTAARNKIKTVATAFNIRADQGINTLITSMNDLPPASTLATGQDTYPTVFDSARDESTTIMSELTKLTVSELGYLYPTGDATTGGVVTWEDRHARPKYGAAAASISGSMIKLNADRSRKNIFNRVKAEVSPREISAAASILFTLQSKPLVAVSGSVLLEGFYTDPAARGILRIGGASMVTPASTTDYLMNSASDGTGTNLTSSLTVSASYGSNSVKYSLINGGTTAGYITLLQARGRVVAIKEPTIAEVLDQTSIDAYGESVLRLTMPYQESALVGEDAARSMLSNWKDPVTIGDKASFIGNESDTLMKYGLWYEPGDKITITEEVTGIDKDYFINGAEIAISERNMIEFTWVLAPAEATKYWLLGIVGASELDLTTIIGY